MRLLLAEDERSLSKALVKILEHNKYSVDAVYDGREALNYIESIDYDGVILDVMMPEMDGFTVLQKMREAGNLTPVLILTAKSEIDDKVSGLDMGANDYLTKPFNTRELLARIRAMLRTSSGVADNRLSFGNISLDKATFKLSSPTGEFTLTNKEYQIMELLLTNPDQVVSTERIFEKIWGLDSDAEINIVWVYISYLRKKLKSLESSVSIKAARGVGYKLEIAETDNK